MSKRSDQRHRAAKRRYIEGEPPREQPRRVTCEFDGCGKSVAVYVPSKGDGSCDVLRYHKNADGERCGGSCRELPSEESAFWL